MADDDRFDEKDALIEAGALQIQAPTLQKARIRRRYARQFYEETKTKDTAVSPPAAEQLKGGTEGRALANPEANPASIGEHDNDLKEAVLRRDRRMRKAAGEYESLLFSGGGRATGSGGAADVLKNSRTRPAFFTQKGSGLTAAFASEAANGAAAFSADGSGSLFYNGSAAIAAPAKTSSEIQKDQIRRSYSGKAYSIYVPVIARIRSRLFQDSPLTQTQKAGIKAAAAAERRPVFLAVMTAALLVIFVITAVASAGVTVVGEVMAASVTATSYSADDEDILGAGADYQALEADLRNRLQHLESLYPGYSHYELQSAEIGHDPYRLAALLTVLFECYTRGEIQDALKDIFDLQYSLQTEDITGTSTTKTVRVGESLGVVVTSGYCNCAICCGQWAGGHTASGVYPQANHTIAVDMWNPIVPMGTKVIMNGIEYTVEDTGPLERYGVAFDVYYDNHQTAQNHGHKRWEAFLADDNGSQTVTVTVVNNEPTLKVTLTNHGLDYAAKQLLNDDLYERYQLLTEMKGNREDLFPDYNALSEYAGLTYAPPGSALSDARFANLYNEAVRHLGTPYVWGGESPGGFDCSGFVSYVINNCGNGWNFGRLTAEEWRQHTMAVSPAEARPGDLVFFQGTYDTSGASHIGIYLGDGMMIHAGHPVQIASINTPYFQQHFLGFGRIPG